MGEANIVPDDRNGIAYSPPPLSLSSFFLTPDQATSGGFYPNGLNGELKTSDRRVGYAAIGRPRYVVRW